MTLYRLPDYVDHMLEAAELACSYIEGMPKEDFLDDKRTQQAVVLNLIVIGEVATKILKEHPDFAGEHTTVPWSREARIYSRGCAALGSGWDARRFLQQISRYLQENQRRRPPEPGDRAPR